jgi:hypothetical protein
MIENLEEYLVGIAIGIRFRPNFSIGDQLGKILDDLLYNKDSTFGCNLFPKVISNIGERSLVNDLTGDIFNINTENFILELNISDLITLESIPALIASFKKEIMDGIMSKYRITQIFRIGYIRRYIYPIEELANNFVNKTIGETLGGVQDIDLKFSKKIPSPSAVAQKNVYDYKNVIFNVIKHADKKEIFMSIDYQEIYEPLLSSVRDIDYTSFINGAHEFNKGTYLSWLKTKYLNN